MSHEHQIEVFARTSSKFESLAKEVTHAITSKADELKLDVKISSRVKNVDSLREKLERKQYESIAEVPDLCGIRVVCMNQMDLKSMAEACQALFLIEEFENKKESQNLQQFGYQAIHLVAVLGDAFSGPRYDEIKKVRFEIQVRTLLQDAWASHQHKLAYKNEDNIREEDKRLLLAIAAQLETVDWLYDQIYLQAKANRLVSELNQKNQNVSAKSIQEFVRRHFADEIDRQSAEKRVSEIEKEHGKMSNGELEEMATKHVETSDEMCEATSTLAGKGGDFYRGTSWKLNICFQLSGILPLRRDLAFWQFARRAGLEVPFAAAEA